MTAIQTKRPVVTAPTTPPALPKVKLPPPAPPPLHTSCFDIKPGRPSLSMQRTQVDLPALRERLEQALAKKAEWGRGEILEDAPNVNDPADVLNFGATQERLANALAEAVALMNLPKEDVAAYRALMDELASTDPVAALALQTMLLEGKFEAHPELLKTLEGVLTQDLAEGIDRAQLLGDLVQELAVPSAINQMNRGTCVATAIGIQLAMNDPTEYARLIAGLATPEGTVTTRGGAVLKREDGVLTDGTNRSVTQRLLAPALMELGNGGRDYDNGDDQSYPVIFGNTIPLGGYSGLYPGDADRILEALYGRDFAFHNISSGKDRDQAADYIRDQVAQGNSVLAAVAWGNGGHQLLVTGTETVDGVEYVTYINPWGSVERMTMDEFKERLRAVNYDPAA